MPPEVVGKTWDVFLKDFAKEWKPGQHIAIIAPTGQGKSTVLVSLLGLRKWALGFDPKGGDETLAATGYPRLPQWPPARKYYDKMHRGEPVSFLVGPKVHKRIDLPRLKLVQQAALRGVFDDGGWTVAVDEFQILSDRRMMNLGTDVETLLISARHKKVSVVTLFQAPRNVPRAAADQSSHLFLGLTLDTDVVNRLAEITGREKAEIRGAITGLGTVDYSWLVVPRNPRRPIVVTVPYPVTQRPRGVTSQRAS